MVSTEQEQSVIKEGSFYKIKDTDGYFVMEDKTKRGLTVQEKSFDERFGVEAEKGMVHDMDGIGHKVGIRWYFSKNDYDMDGVVEQAEGMEKKYKELRELTCPDD